MAHSAGSRARNGLCGDAATFVLPPSEFSAIMTSYNHPVGQLLGLAAAWVAGQATLPRSAVVGRLAYVRMEASMIVATGLFVLGLLSCPPSVFVFVFPALPRPP